jgi:putative transcriptional regulator
VIKVRINEELERHGRTLYWLAKESGIRYATVWSWSRGEVARLNLQALDSICEALDCQPGDLLVRETTVKSQRKLRGK